MSDNQMLVLNRADLESLGLTWSEIIDVLGDAFPAEGPRAGAEPAQAEGHLPRGRSFTPCRLTSAVRTGSA